MILLWKIVKCFCCDVPKQFRTLPADFGHPWPIFNFFVISKKARFRYTFGIRISIFESCEFYHYFGHYNGKFILDILNKNQITIKIVCTMRNVTKSIPPKKCFFWNDKKLKIGRGWPKSAGRVLNRFGTSQQKHLTPFHNKIMLLSSILKKYRRPKGGWLFLDSTVALCSMRAVSSLQGSSQIVKEHLNFHVKSKFISTWWMHARNARFSQHHTEANFTKSGRVSGGARFPRTRVRARSWNGIFNKSRCFSTSWSSQQL